MAIPTDKVEGFYFEILPLGTPTPEEDPTVADVYLTDDDGAFLIDDDGAFLIDG